MPADKRPQLIMAYFDEPDHGMGRNSKQRIIHVKDYLDKNWCDSSLTPYLYNVWPYYYKIVSHLIIYKVFIV